MVARLPRHFHPDEREEQRNRRPDTQRLRVAQPERKRPS
jgi:hypothetical protein